MRYFLLFFSLFTLTISFSQTLSSQCSSTISGNIIDKEHNKPIPQASITIKDKDGKVKTLQSDANGHFQFEAPCSENRYIVSAVFQNYTKGNSLIFTTRDRKRDQHIDLNLYPIKEFITIKGVKRIIVENINFLPNDKSLTKEAQKTLDKVYKTMDKYPNIKVEIGFHTDSRGDDDYLMKLTQERADICANYLTNKGIYPERIIAKGYGDKVLLNECVKGVKCSEEKHLMNRRSEFVVIQE